MPARFVDGGLPWAGEKPSGEVRRIEAVAIGRGVANLANRFGANKGSVGPDEADNSPRLGRYPQLRGPVLSPVGERSTANPPRRSPAHGALWRGLLVDP